MSPENLQASDPANTSPCVKNCCLNEQDVCLGCGRSLDEIKQWQSADLNSRRQFRDNAQRRLAQLNYARNACG